MNLRRIRARKAHERLKRLEATGVRLEVVDGEGRPYRVDVRLAAGPVGSRRTVSQITLVLRSELETVEGRRLGTT